jgi:hypothetical protein
MANWIEFEVDAEFGREDLVEWVTLSMAARIVTYYTHGEGHSITYVDQAAALAAYDEWKAAHPPPTPPYLVDGDLVRINKASDANSIRVEEPIIFHKAPLFEDDYWVFEDGAGIFIVDEEVTVVKV